MPPTFINREQELAWLNGCYEKARETAQLLIVYGKRRVGKTELMKHFIEGKPHIYYLANRTTSEEQLRSATSVFAQGLGDDYLKPGSFQHWRDFFDYIGKKIKERNEPMIVIFDEFPYLAESHAGMSSFVQYAWDTWLKDARVIVILMGSSIAMMYKHALVHSAPLYGRRTGQWLLEPFDYRHTTQFYPGGTFARMFPLYAVSGGIPAYARVFDGKKSFQQNIIQQVLTEGSFLSVEPELLLADEFTDQRSYLTILKAIGAGRTKFSEIVQEAGLPATALPGYLKTLTHLRLVQKEVQVTETLPEKSKKGAYSLADPFLRFYFSFIFPQASLVKSGNFETLFSRHGGRLTALLAKAYEDATKEFVGRAISQGALPHFERLGRWWDKNTEIDLVGLNEEKNAVLFVETKWNEKPLDASVLKDVREKARRLAWGREERKEYYCVVAKGGFTDHAVKEARERHTLLIQEDKVMTGTS